MMTVIFVGPTVPIALLRDRLDADYQPPAAQGDVFRAVEAGARFIGIIDGFFESVPSVWHKEILWAIDRGVHVFGSASMGALRAAELHVFGMRGVGRIFEAYRDGAYEDDDEVAVTHGPAEAGFVAVSEPMVNIRATLDRAVADTVIAAPTRDRLVAAAKALFYQHRTWDAVLGSAAADEDMLDVDIAEIDRLRGWLPGGIVDQKRDDALAMIAEMTALIASRPAPSRPQWRFEWTEMWDDATRTFPTVGRQETGAAKDLRLEHFLEELRLDAETYADTRQGALLRLLAQRESGRLRLAPDPAAVRGARNRFRAQNRLMLKADVTRWLDHNDVSEAELDGMLAR